MDVVLQSSLASAVGVSSEVTVWIELKYFNNFETWLDLLAMSFSAAPLALRKLPNSTSSGSDFGKQSLRPAIFRAALTA